MEYFKEKNIILTYKCRNCEKVYSLEPLKINLTRYSSFQHAKTVFDKRESLFQLHRCERLIEEWGIADLIRIEIK